jgi:FkbM family methyltransferase
MTSLKQKIISKLADMGVALTSEEHVTKLQRDAADNFEEAHRKNSYLSLLASVPSEQVVPLVHAAQRAASQLGQDLFVLSETGLKRHGYFVEFGATNGVTRSNTFLLEKDFGWSGLLAEPAKCWQSQLHRNRSCKIEEVCVWKETGKTLLFHEVPEADFSTILAFNDGDRNKHKRKHGVTYEVRTISLCDLLEKGAAPREIDYLSIDTEGSELEILKSFDFNRHSFRVITCEHNNSPARQEIFSLLSRHGYVRKFENLSAWDDWYVRVS